MSFPDILGEGRGRRPAIPSAKVDYLIADLGCGGETIAVEQTINRTNLSPHNRQRLKEALGKRRLTDQAQSIKRTLQAVGFLPLVDSQGLLYKRKMHRWDGQWHSPESLLMAPVSLHGTSFCGIEVRGGDGDFQPLGLDDWQRRPLARCPNCPDPIREDGDWEARMEEILADKRWPETDDILALRRDPWSTVLARILHPLDLEEIDQNSGGIEAAWRQVIGEVLPQQPPNREAVAARALECLER